MKHLIISVAICAAMLFSSVCSAAFVINEIDADDGGTDNLEFIELKGDPSESANGLFLIFYNGGSGSANPGCYWKVDLNGLTADANGYLVVANPDVATKEGMFPGDTLQNGEDALALYGPPATYDSFTTATGTNGTHPTMTGLVDHIIYETGADANATWTALTATPVVYDENAIVGKGTELSLSRIPDGTGTFTNTARTVHTANTNIGQGVPGTLIHFRRQNQFTTVEGTTRTLTIRNANATPLNVSTFAFDPASSSAFTVLVPPAQIPITLQYDEESTMVVQLSDPTATENKVYGGAVNWATDNPTSPSGTAVLYGELVRATTPANVGDVLINELCYMPASFDWNKDGAIDGQYDEFIELYNTTASPINIEGWEQRTRDRDAQETSNYFIFPAGATIPANGFVVVFSGGNPVGFDPATTFVFENNAARFRNSPHGAYVNLRDGADKQIDGIAYLLAQTTPVPVPDTFTSTGINADIGGYSFGRRPDGSSTFMIFNNLTGMPTPGATNNVSAASDWSLFE